MANKPLLMTDRWVESVKVHTDREEWADLKIQGLRLRVSGSGRKVWICRARAKTKVLSKTLGRYPVMTLGKARTAALGVLEVIAQGDTDVLDRTFKELSEAWVERHAKPKNKSWAQQEQRLNDYAVPVIGKRKVRDIRRADIRELVQGLEGEVLPNRVLATLKTAFRWAVENDWIESDPTQGVKKPRAEVSRDRVLSMDEIATIWREAGELGFPFTEYVRTLLLTGQRRSEIAGAKWDWIDLKAATLTLPASETKNGRAHLVPLSPQVVEILKAMPRLGDAGYVFTTTSTSPISGFTKLKAKLDKAIGEEVGGWVFHDLRRAFATHAVRLGVLGEVVGKVLNHTAQGVTARVYALHQYEPERRSALDRWANEVARAVDGRSQAKVVPIRPGK